MSLNKKSQLAENAKVLSSELRKNSTLAEKNLWVVLRDKNIENKKFYRQHPIFYDLNGRETFFIVDFYCHQAKLVIEIDGKYHDYRLKEDKNRMEMLNLLGLKVIRFSNEEICTNIDLVKERIKNEII